MALQLRSHQTFHKYIGTWNVCGIKMRHLMRRASPWTIRTNSIGARDDREFEIEAKENQKRIAILGDSFTFGFGVEVEYRYSNILEMLFRDKFQLLNFGLCSAGIDQQYLVHRHISDNYNCDAVLISPYLNNVARCELSRFIFQDLHGNRVYAAKPYFILDDKGKLVLKNYPVQRKPKKQNNNNGVSANQIRSSRRIIEDIEYSSKLKIARIMFLHRRYKYWFMRVIPIQPYKEFDTPNNPSWRLGREIFLQLAKEIYPRPLIVSPLPAWTSIVNPNLAKYRYRYTELEADCDNLYFLDLLPHFLQLDHSNKVECFISQYDSHYSEIGHKVAACAIKSEMDRKSIVDLI